MRVNFAGHSQVRHEVHSPQFHRPAKVCAGLGSGLLPTRDPDTPVRPDELWRCLIGFSELRMAGVDGTERKFALRRIAELDGN